MRAIKLATIIAVLSQMGFEASCAAEPATFVIGEIKYDLPIPAGYCVPIGVDADAAGRVAASNPGSNTLFFFQKCDTDNSLTARD